jgi:hypothetical protein
MMKTIQKNTKTLFGILSLALVCLCASCVPNYQNYAVNPRPAIVQNSRYDTRNNNMDPAMGLLQALGGGVNNRSFNNYNAPATGRLTNNSYGYNAPATGRLVDGYNNNGYNNYNNQATGRLTDGYSNGYNDSYNNGYNNSYDNRYENNYNNDNGYNNYQPNPANTRYRKTIKTTNRGDDGYNTQTDNVPVRFTGQNNDFAKMVAARRARLNP